MEKCVDVCVCQCVCDAEEDAIWHLKNKNRIINKETNKVNEHIESYSLSL